MYDVYNIVQCRCAWNIHTMSLHSTILSPTPNSNPLYNTMNHSNVINLDNEVYFTIPNTQPMKEPNELKGSELKEAEVVETKA